MLFYATLLQGKIRLKKINNMSILSSCMVMIMITINTDLKCL